MKTNTLIRPDGSLIAYHYFSGRSPGVIFCGGLMSDMTGTKALALENHCRTTGRSFLRFDYRGHGQSSGVFHESTIGDWKEDTLAMLDEITQGPQIIVGSSMGGWISLLVALDRPERIKAVVGIAAAPDFVISLWEELPAQARKILQDQGVYARPSEYSDTPYMISMQLIEEARNHLLLANPIPIHCPVRLLHGQQDPDVPWQLSIKLAEMLESDDVDINLIKNGDHRLSGEDDIARMLHTVDSLVSKLESET